MELAEEEEEEGEGEAVEVEVMEVVVAMKLVALGEDEDDVSYQRFSTQTIYIPSFHFLTHALHLHAATPCLWIHTYMTSSRALRFSSDPCLLSISPSCTTMNIQLMMRSRSRHRLRRDDGPLDAESPAALQSTPPGRDGEAESQLHRRCEYPLHQQPVVYTRDAY